MINIICSIITILLAFGLNYLYFKFPVFLFLFEKILRVEDIKGTEVLMLPLAFSIGNIINLCLLWYFFEKNFQGFTRAIIRTIIQGSVASIFAGYISYLFLNIFDDLFSIDTVLGVFYQGLFSGLIGIFFGVIILKILRNQEIDEVWKTLHSKIWKIQPKVADNL